MTLENMNEECLKDTQRQVKDLIESLLFLFWYRGVWSLLVHETKKRLHIHTLRFMAISDEPGSAWVKPVASPGQEQKDGLTYFCFHNIIHFYEEIFWGHWVCDWVSFSYRYEQPDKMSTQLNYFIITISNKKCILSGECLYPKCCLQQKSFDLM